MPTYQYACTECGHQLEVQQSFSDDPLTECPACTGRLRKIYNAVGVVFKGSGFYRTDSRKEGTGSAKPSGDSTAKPAADAGSGSSKPASTSSTSSTSSASSTSSSAS